MVFNDTTDKNGLIQECETWLFGSDYGAISSNTKLLATFTRLLNYGLDEVTAIIFQTDGKWQFDDSNYTDYPIAFTNLLSGQQDYTLDVSHLKITAVEVKDSAGNFRPLKQIDLRDINNSGIAQDEFLESDAMPQYYDLIDSAIFLYPAPATGYVTTTNGLKLFMQRQPSYFVSSDTTKKPGIPAIFHDIVALFACQKYAKSNSMFDKSTVIDNELTKRIKALKDFFNTRNVDMKKRITPRKTCAV